MKTELIHVDFGGTEFTIIITIIRQNCLYGIRLSGVKDLVYLSHFSFSLIKDLIYLKLNNLKALTLCTCLTPGVIYCTLEFIFIFSIFLITVGWLIQFYYLILS